MSQDPDITKLEPRRVWDIFSGMSSVPRPSKREEKIRAHMLQLAKELGLEANEDGVGNIVIRAPASPGFESVETTVLQGHVDMVCEKNADKVHNFDEDPIRLVLDRDAAGEEIVRADGTTLGADNGMGVAMALAAASSPEVIHGPLEILLTTDEETGMTGAKALTPESFSGRRLINLDSEEDDCIYIGCAGGCDNDIRWNLQTAAPPASEVSVRVLVRGLRGGHSGCDIHENRGNAIHLLARALLESGAALRIATIQGGSMRNAIPREAEALVSILPSQLDALRSAAEMVTAAGRVESVEHELEIRVDTAEASEQCASADESWCVLSALRAFPSGVISMHPEIPGLVQTSNNLSTVRYEAKGGQIEIAAGLLTRSSLPSAVEDACDQIGAIATLAGASVKYGNEYPGWQPNVDSALLETAKTIYRETFETDAEVAAIHAGLECGIIGSRVGSVDMVSFGPRIEGAHSPDERVYTESVKKSWRFLTAVLESLARNP